METSTHFFSLFTSSFSLLLFFFFFFAYTASCVQICPPSSCDESGELGPLVRFPFRITDQQPDRCWLPGFALSCNNQNQTVLSLPYSGEFIVTQIDYDSQRVFINDPDSCLPKRFLNFNLSGTPFRRTYSRDYTFFNCSAQDWPEYILTESVPVFCLSNTNYTVIAMDSYYLESESPPPVCRNFSRVEVPVELWAVNPIEDVQLTWRVPRCGACEAAGGTCGYEGESGMKIRCTNIPSTSDSGLPRSAKYGIIIGVGVPGLVCLMGLACFTIGKIRTYGQRRRLDAELSVLAIDPVAIVTGLDGSTIESYPKTVLGESRRLPKPNDSTCPICLAEYQPTETLRTIPECNHYFHSDCVDEWLRMNATCPLCRNTPSESSESPPMSSSSSSSP